MKVLVAIVVAAALPCFASSQNSCENAGGMCLEADNAEGYCTVMDNKCPSASHVCCQTVSPDAKFTNSKVWTCTGLADKCLKKQGRCIHKTELSLCPSSTYRRKNLCYSSSCVCCIKKKTKCRPTKKCRKKDGFCFIKGKGKGCSSGLVLKNGCKGKKCACCIPGPVVCNLSAKCKSHDGFCIAKKYKHKCLGTIVGKACKGKGCVCCIPDKPTPTVIPTTAPVTTTPAITTTPATTTTPVVTTTPAVTTTTTPSSGCRCGIINDRRIVGGEQVMPANKYPWVVGLDVMGNSSYDCAGNIINDRYVLTAAHCLFDQSSLQPLPLSDIQVGIADHDQSSTADDVPGVTRRVGVQEVIVFDNFSIVNVDFDIALLKLEQPLDLTAREIGPICLPANDDQTYGGVVGTAVGWGQTGETEGQPDILREVDIPILEKAACEALMVNFFTITDTMICAGTQEGGKDACGGDSGGPLSVVEGEQQVLVGVSAFGEGCARPAIPGVYSRVSKYLDWISENTQDAIYCP